MSNGGSSFPRGNFIAAAAAAVGAAAMATPLEAAADGGRKVQVNDISMYVEEHGSGTGKPVLMLHGWPDTANVWRYQVPFLVANGFRVITPDLRGFGRTDWPADVSAYTVRNSVNDAVALLDAYRLESAYLVGHDWGSAVAWTIAALHPERVRKLVAISVPHPLSPVTLRQREMGWYQLFFQFTGIAEASLQNDDWALFRELLRNNGDIDSYVLELARKNALTSSLNWYRANVAPHAPAPPRSLPLVQAPTLGIWSTNDHYIDGERMKISERFVKGSWRYKQIEGASHWIQLDAPARLNQLINDWLT
jgi:pimeloyl-ACP methyl ester carboxylesterase